MAKAIESNSYPLILVRPNRSIEFIKGRAKIHPQTEKLLADVARIRLANCGQVVMKLRVQVGCVTRMTPSAETVEALIVINPLFLIVIDPTEPPAKVG